jgi:hypothetical protein
VSQVPPKAPIQVFDSSLNFVGEVDAYSSLSHVRGWNAPGAWSVKINWNVMDDSKTIRYAALFTIGGFVTIGGDGTKCGIITSIERPIDEGGKQSQDVVISGYEPTIIFNRRMIDVPAAQDFYTLNAPAETVIKTAVSAQAGPTATNANRAFPLLSIAADQGRGTTYLLSVAYTELLGELTNCSVATKLGFFISLDRTNKLLILDCALGVNRTSGNNPNAIFSSDYDTLKSADLKESNEQFKNLVTVTGQGTGQARPVLDVFTGTEPAGFARFETTVNANNLSTTPDLTSKGVQQLATFGYTKSLDATILAKSQLVYQTDYNLGDFVTVAAYDFSVDVQITAMQESWEALQYDLVPTFDKAPPTITSQMATSSKTIAAATSNLGLPVNQSSTGQSLYSIGGVQLTPFIEDYRSTTGGSRTETVDNLNVEQTALLDWQLMNNTGGTVSIVLALPASGTYAVALMVDSTGGASNTLAVATNVSFIRTKGTVAGGTTVTILSLGAGTGGSLFGTVRRIT